MTVKQLREALEGVPDHLDVYLDAEVDEFGLAYAGKAEVQNIPFKEEPGGKTLCRENVFVITDSFK